MREGESIASAGRSSTPTRHRALIETLLSPEAGVFYRKAVKKLKAAIAQPVYCKCNGRTTKTLFEMKGQEVILPGVLWSELSVMGRWMIHSIVLRWRDLTVGLRHETPEWNGEAALALLLPNDDADRAFALADEPFAERRARRSDVDHAIPFSLRILLPALRALNNATRANLPERALFLAHAGTITGHNLQDFGRREQGALFSSFKDAVEYTARNRVAERWAG